MAFYLLKFACKIGNPEKRYASAQYSLGFAEGHRVRTRIAEQLSGGQEAARTVQHAGSSLGQAVVESGIGITVPAVYPGLTREDERRAKQSSHLRRLDPEHRTRPFKGGWKKPKGLP